MKHFSAQLEHLKQFIQHVSFAHSHTHSHSHECTGSSQGFSILPQGYFDMQTGAAKDQTAKPLI